MSYTNIPKPTGSSYTDVNSSGKEGFDDAGVTFDQASTFFDGSSTTAYTDVGKPNGFGLYQWSAMTLSWSDADEIWGSSTSYTNIPKPI